MVRKAINFVWNFLDDFQKQQLAYYSTDLTEFVEAIGAENLE